MKQSIHPMYNSKCENISDTELHLDQLFVFYILHLRQAFFFLFWTAVKSGFSSLWRARLLTSTDFAGPRYAGACSHFDFPFNTFWTVGLWVCECWSNTSESRYRRILRAKLKAFSMWARSTSNWGPPWMFRVSLLLLLLLCALIFFWSFFRISIFWGPQESASLLKAVQLQLNSRKLPLKHSSNMVKCTSWG